MCSHHQKAGFKTAVLFDPSQFSVLVSMITCSNYIIHTYSKINCSKFLHFRFFLLQVILTDVQVFTHE